MKSSVIFLPALLCRIVSNQTNASIYLTGGRIVVFDCSRDSAVKVSDLGCVAERADTSWRAGESTTAGLKGETSLARSLACFLYPRPPPLRSCNPAAVEGSYCCAPLFDAHCTYLHFSALRSFHVRRPRIKYTRGGFVRDGSFWGLFVAADGAAAPRCRREARAEVRRGRCGGSVRGRREGAGPTAGIYPLNIHSLN